jgi:hypothetical protein
MGQVAPVMPLQFAIHVAEVAFPVTGPAFVVLARIRPQLDYRVPATSLKTAGGLWNVSSPKSCMADGLMLSNFVFNSLQKDNRTSRNWLASRIRES